MKGIIKISISLLILTVIGIFSYFYVIPVFALTIPESIDWSNTKSVSDYGITLSSPADYTTCSISPDNGNGWDKCYAYVTIDNKFQDINNFDFSTKWDKPDMVRDIKYSYTTTSQTTTVPETVILNETTNKTIDKSMNTFGAFSVNKLPINYGTTSAIRIDFEKRRWQEVAFNATISVIPKNMGIDNIINIELDPDVSACGNLDTANSVYTLTANVSSANYCFHIIANNITLDGAGYWVNYSQSAAGYGVNNSGGYDNITVKNLNIVQGSTSSNSYAIYGSGMANSNITNNNITTSGTNGYGIYLYLSSNSNTLSNNTITTSGNTGVGIYLSSSSNSSITGNKMSTTNAYAIYVGTTTTVSYYNHIIDTTNTEQGKPIYYYFAQSNMTIQNLYNIGQLYVANSTNITIKNITIISKDGIILAMTKNSSVSNSNITTGTQYGVNGIYLYSSSTNTLSSNNITTSGGYGYGIYLISSSNSNTLSNNNVTTLGSGGYGIVLDSSITNTFSNNNITTSGTNSYGIYLYLSSTNTIIDGSIISKLSFDYYLENVGTTNNFTNTNFTAQRRIYFYGTTSWFNYNNETSGNIWLKTNVLAAGSINRTLSSWNNTLMKWNDTNSTKEITANYNLTGLQANTLYGIFNTTNFGQSNPYTITTNGNGALNFTIFLIRNTEITVNSTDTTPPTFSLNSTNTTIAGTSIRHNLYWSDNIGLFGMIFSFDNGTGTFMNDSWISMTGTFSWANISKVVNSTIGSTIRWIQYANDSSNNWNTSNIYSYTTISSDSPPVISSISNNPTIVGYGNNVTINFTVTDDNLVSKVFTEIIYPNTTKANYTTNNISVSNYQLNFSNTWQKGQYLYKIYANDTANQWISSNSYTFNVSINATFSLRTINDSYPLNYQVNLTDPPLEITDFKNGLLNRETDNNQDVPIISKIISKNGTVLSSEILSPNAIVPVIIELENQPLQPYQKIAEDECKTAFMTYIYNIFMDRKNAEIKVKNSIIQKHILNIQDERKQTEQSVKNIGAIDIGKIKYEYLFNGFTAKVNQSDIERIKTIKGVKNVWIDENLTTQTIIPSVIQMNANKVWLQKDSNNRNITGFNITVAVIDTGIDYTHPDLGNCTNTSFLAGTCSRVTWGWDYVNNDNNPMDDHGHGTHVAGIVGANGTLIGVAPDAKFLAYKVCNSGGSCPNSYIISAIENATLRGASVISVSLGGGGYADSVFTTPIDNAVNNGTVVVVAAGNSGSSYDTVGTPASTLSAITVGAIDSSNIIASFSSRGYAYYSNGSIAGIKPDVVSYGVSINSTVPSGSCSLCDTSKYKVLSGTSMSTPHVSGTIALLKQAHPEWTATQIKSAIANPATNLGYDANTQGSGNVDALKSYNSTSFVKEINIFSGVDTQNDTSNWTSVYSFNMSNPTNNTNTYNLSLSGISEANLSNISIQLSSNQSVLINLTLNIDNSLKTDGRYYGKVVVSTNSSTFNLTVPFSFLKTKSIYLVTGANLWFTNIIKPDGTLSLSLSSKNGTIFVNKGEYYIESVFSGCPNWVNQSCTAHENTFIFNYVNLTDTLTVYANKSMANYKLNYSILDENGMDLVNSVYPNGEYGGRYQCRISPFFNRTCTSSWTIVLVFNNSVKFQTYSSGTISPLFFNNDLKNKWTFSHFHQISTNNSQYYIAKSFTNNLSQNQILLSSNWSNLTIVYDYLINSSNITRSILTEVSHGINYMIQANSDYRNIITDTNNKSTETIFITPNTNTSGEMSGALEFQRIGEFIEIIVWNTTRDPTQASLCNGCNYKWYNSPLLYPINKSFWESHLFDWYIPKIEDTFILDENKYNFGNTTSYWNGEFSNTGNPSDSTQIDVHPYYGGYIRQIVKQNNIWQGNVIPITYNLINTSGNIVSSGTVNAEFFRLTGLSQTKYTMTFTSINTDKINNISGSIYINTTFNLSASNKNPPRLDFIRFLSNNRTTNYINNAQENRVIFKSPDATAQNVYYRANGQSNWIGLTITSEKTYNVSVFPSLNQGYYDFRYNSTDSANNTLIQENIPAFYIYNSTVFDTQLPIITIVSPLNQSYITNWTWANVTLNEAGSWCGYSLDSGSNQTMSNSSTTAWYYNISGLSQTQHNIKFYCNDTSGNMGSSSAVYFTINTAGNIITSLNPTLSLVLKGNESIDLTQNAQIGVKLSRLKKGNNRIGDISINFTSSFDWSDVVSDTGNYTKSGITYGKSYLHIPVSHTEVVNKTIYIPAIANTGEFYICNGASSFSMINETCPNIIYYDHQTAVDGYYSINISGTGGGETLTKSMINNTGSTAFNGYLLLKIQKNVSNVWSDFKIIINDTSSRNITNMTALALDTIWFNAGAWTSNETGTFRVFGQFNDPNGIVLQADDGTYLNDTYIFNVTNTIAPTITINAPLDGSYFNKNWVMLNYTPINIINASMTCWHTLDSVEISDGSVSNNTAKTFNMTSLSEASHTVSAKCFDGTLNGTSSTNTFTVDLTAPTITSPSPANNSYVLGSSAQVFSVSVNDGVSLNTSSGLFYEKYPSGTFFTSHIMTCTISSCSYTLDMSSTNNGDIWSYYFEINDTAGNLGYNGTALASLQVNIDKAAPTITILLPANTTYTSVNRTLNYSVIDSGSGVNQCWYSYNNTNTTLTNCANTSFIALNNQQSTLTLFANDSIGNINSISVTFTVNTILPQWSNNITSLNSPQTYAAANNYGFQINWSASAGFANATFQLGRPGGSLTNYSQDYAGAALPVDNSLVLHMKLDTVNGTNYTLDNSQYRNDGLMKNFEPAPINNFSAAVFANGTNFDGVNDYVNAGNNPSLDITNAITISAWIKRNNTGVRQFIIEKEKYVSSADRQGWLIEIQADNTARFTLENNAGTAITSTETLSVGVWYFIVAGFDATTKYIYINTTKYSNAVGIFPAITSNSLFIGSEDGTSRYFNGSIDEVRIFNRALSATESKRLYNRTRILFGV